MRGEASLAAKSELDSYSGSHELVRRSTRHPAYHEVRWNPSPVLSSFLYLLSCGFRHYPSDSALRIDSERSTSASWQAGKMLYHMALWHCTDKDAMCCRRWRWPTAVVKSSPKRLAPHGTIFYHILMLRYNITLYCFVCIYIYIIMYCVTL